MVLHLGCGLDARVFRIDPPDTVDWFDLDYSPVRLAKAPPAIRRFYRLMNLLPGFAKSSRIVRFRF